MSGKTTPNRRLIVFALLLVLSSLARARTITVGPGPGYDFDTIQAAIDDANDSDTVVIMPGTYTGDGNRDLDFHGKAITVCSTDPNDPNVVAATVIDCNGSEAEPHRGFYLQNDEGPNSVIAGLTITNGYASDGGGIHGGGTTATISNCIIIGNEATNRGGLYSCDGTIANCTITNNTAIFGGGLNYCDGTITNCTISGNNANDNGGGLSNCDGTITNCIISGNTANRYIGGLSNCDGTITNCIISGNTAAISSGGLSACDGIITNCTIFGNTDNDDIGGGLNNCDGSITNCIIWNNGSSPLRNCSTPSYSCVPGYSYEITNIDADPCFVNPDQGDYHLSPYSPCINAGDPNYIPADGETDIDGQPRIMGTYLDIGAVEFHFEGPFIEIEPRKIKLIAHKDSGNPDRQYLAIWNDGPGIVNWVITEDCNWLSLDVLEGSCSTGEIDEVEINADVTNLTFGEYLCELTISDPCATNNPRTALVTLRFTEEPCLHVPSDYDTIQSAIDSAVNGDLIIIAPGIYTGDGNRDLDFLGKAITVQSTDPNDPNIVAATIIDCNGSESEPHRGFNFHCGEGHNSVLTGVTITNGYATFGAGIFCLSNSNPTISRCVISHNISYGGGGGILSQNSSPIISHCDIYANSGSWGGGIYFIGSLCRPIITDCNIRDNFARREGGGICCKVEASITVRASTIANNRATENGGGISLNTDATEEIDNCVISNNSAETGGGVYIDKNREMTILRNCLIANNSAQKCGGIYIFQGDTSISNCTIVGNTAESDQVGKGLYVVPGWDIVVVSNTIIWDDLFATDSSCCSPSISYSDIQGGWSGKGNIDSDPHFINAENENYHLSWDSPCINMGDPNYVPESGETDIDGELRVACGIIDMGADELVPQTPIIRFSPKTIVFPTFEGEPNPESQLLSIWNGGIGVLNWQITEDCDWLEVEPNSGSSVTTTNEVTLSVDTAGLTRGVYDCNLIISDPNAGNSPGLVQVSLGIATHYPLSVPSDYPTIQEAIDVALDGNTVIVALGTYTGEGNKDLDFLGKAITVRSTDPNDPNVVAATVIDCNGSKDDPHRGFYFHSGEGPDSIVSGFTIRNGYIYSDANDQDAYGGGIYCSDSSPTISNCVITNNEVHGKDGGSVYPDTDGEKGYGGGIYCASNSNPTIIGCTISNNTVIGGDHGHGWTDEWQFSGDGGDGYGGGIYCDSDSSPAIIDCTISNNAAEGGEGDLGSIDIFPTPDGRGYGGGIYIGSVSSVAIEGCVIVSNTASGGGGGGISCGSDSRVSINNCTIDNNKAEGCSSAHGGGIRCSNAAELSIENSDICNNKAIGRNGFYDDFHGWEIYSAGDAYGGGIYCDEVSGLSVENSSICNNSASAGRGSDARGGGYARGGGIYLRESIGWTITNCTITGNVISGGDGGGTYETGGAGGVGGNAYGGGISCGENSECTIENCVIADNIISGGDGGNGDLNGTAGDGGDAYGGGVSNSGDSYSTIRNCTITNNTTTPGNGGTAYGGGADGADGDTYGAGTYCDTGSIAAITNSIAWANIGADAIYGANHDVNYSDIQGGWPGEGNIDNDPCFVTGPQGDYYLSQVAAGQAYDSLCVDTGSNTAANLEMDVFTTRTDQIPDTNIADMGYHYPAPIKGDIDGDGDIDLDDFVLFAAHWSKLATREIPMGDVIVDGDLSEWSNEAEWMALDKVYSGNPADVNQAKFALRWNPEADKIYMAVVINDSNHWFTDEYVTWDASDRLEVYSQGNAEGGTGWYGMFDAAQKYYVAPNTAGGSWATWADATPIGADADFEYAVDVNGDSIVYEIGIKAFDNYGGISGGDTIVTDLNRGGVVRFDIVANTRRSDGFGMLSENMMTGKYGDADQFAKYTLVEQIYDTPYGAFKADLDENGIVDWPDLVLLAENWLWEH